MHSVNSLLTQRISHANTRPIIPPPPRPSHLKCSFSFARPVLGTSYVVDQCRLIWWFVVFKVCSGCSGSWLVLPEIPVFFNSYFMSLLGMTRMQGLRNRTNFMSGISWVISMGHFVSFSTVFKWGSSLLIMVW